MASLSTKQDILFSVSAKADLVCADNLRYMKALPDESVMLVVTSPPYNIGKTYEQRIPLAEYVRAQAAVITECVRLLHPNGSICWQVGNLVDNGEVVPLDIVIYPLFQKLGLKLRNRIIWHFGHGLHCSKRLSGRHESILWFTKNDDYLFNLDAIRVPAKYPGKKHFKGPKRGQLSGNPQGKNPGDVWKIPNVKSNHVEKTIHPCQFPVELVERLVLALTNTGDSVFDPYVGVGSTVLAAIKNGRNGYGCDISREYIDIANERLTQLKAGKLKLRPMGRPIYDPTKPGGGQR